MRGLEDDVVEQNVGIRAEDGADFAQPPLPQGPVELQRLSGGQHFRFSLLGRKVGRGIFFLGPHLLLGLDLQQRVERLAVSAVCGVPEGALDGGAVVGKR